MGEMGVCPVCRKPFAQSITEIPFMKKKSCMLTKEQKQRRQKILGITRKERTPSLTANQARNTTLQKLCPIMENEAVVSTRCGHVFHKVCLRDYCHTFRSLRKKGLVECPICKQRIVVTGATVLDLRALEGYSEVTEQKLKFAKVMNKELKDQFEPLIQRIENLKQNTSEEERILVELEKRAEAVRGQWSAKRNEYNIIISLIDEVKSLDDNETKLQMENRRLTTIYLAIITHEMSSCKPNQRVPKELYPYLKAMQKHPEVIDSFREVICPLPLVNRKTMSRNELIKFIIDTVRKSQPDEDKHSPSPAESWENFLQYPVDRLDATRREAEKHDTVTRTLEQRDATRREAKKHATAKREAENRERREREAARRIQPNRRPEGPILSSTLSPSSGSSLESLTVNEVRKSECSTPAQTRPSSPHSSEHADEECDWEPLLAYNRKKMQNVYRPTNFYRPSHHAIIKKKAVRFRLKDRSISIDNRLTMKQPSSTSSEIHSSAISSHYQQAQDQEAPPSTDSMQNSSEDGVERQTSKDSIDVNANQLRRVVVHPDMTSFPADHEALSRWRQQVRHESSHSPALVGTSSEEGIETLRPVRATRNMVHQQPRTVEHKKSRVKASVTNSISASAILVKPDVRYPKLLVNSGSRSNLQRRTSKTLVRPNIHRSTSKSLNQTNFHKKSSKSVYQSLPLVPRDGSKSVSRNGFERRSSKAMGQRLRQTTHIASAPELNPRTSLGFNIDEHLGLSFESNTVTRPPSLTGLDIPLNPKPERNIPFSRIQADTIELCNKLTNSMSATDLLRELEKESLNSTLIKIENRLTEYRGVYQRVSSVSIIRPPEMFQAQEQRLPETRNSIRQTVDLLERTLASLVAKDDEHIPLTTIHKPPSSRRLQPRSTTPRFRRLALPAPSQTNSPRPVWARLPEIHPTPSASDRRTPLQFALRPGSRSAPLPKYARIRRIPLQPNPANRVPSLTGLPPLPSTSSSETIGEHPQKKFKDIFSVPCTRVQGSTSIRSEKALERPTNSGDCQPDSGSQINWSEICDLLPPGKLGMFCGDSHL